MSAFEDRLAALEERVRENEERTRDLEHKHTRSEARFEPLLGLTDRLNALMLRLEAVNLDLAAWKGRMLGAIGVVMFFTPVITALVVKLIK